MVTNRPQQVHIRKTRYERATRADKVVLDRTEKK